MTHFTHLPLQQAMYETLSGDATLSAIISGVFDHVPQETAYPFVMLGEAVVRDWSNLEHAGTEQMVTVRVYSRESGRKQAATIMERIITLLNHENLSVAGNTLALLQVASSSIALQDDGATYRGTLIFRGLLSEA